jgi:hypothetical protein
MNAERISVAQGCVGGGRWLLTRASNTPRSGVVREIRLYQTVPISTNLVLAYIGQRVLSMPRSY